MRVTQLTSAFVLTAAGTACTSVSEPATGAQSAQADTQLAVRDACKPAGSDPFSLAKLAVDGNKLVIDVTSGGGCAAHDFALCWNGASTRSMPPQVRLSLSHNANGDSCKALVTRQLRVDLAPLFAELPPPVMVFVTGAQSVSEGGQDQILIEAR